MSCKFIVGLVVMLAGLGFAAVAAWAFVCRPACDGATIAVVAICLLGGGAKLAFGSDPFPGLKLPGGIVLDTASDGDAQKFQRRALPEETKRNREAFARDNPPPAHDAPAFNAMADAPDLAAMPAADCMTPMYLLDKNFRILDWNEAFSLAFDNTMEGRRGQGALEWVYFLDNFRDVLEHGRTTFSDPDNLPAFDKEEVRYTSLNYKNITATKRAYRFPDDDGNYAGWVVLLDLKFADSGQAERYSLDLAQKLGKTLLWSRYAVCYDQVLLSSGSYDELLRRMLGEDGGLPPIPDRARVLDLGAGTGNATIRLARGGRIVVALENNRTMLHLLRAKCQMHGVPLRRNDAGPGVIVIKQDANSLFGLSDDYFDCVVANNVLYSLDSPEDCLKEVHRVLRHGGEIRLSGPAKGFSLDKVFRRIKAELIGSGKFNDFKYHYEQARSINFLLEPALRKWADRDAKELLAQARLEVTGGEPYYGGHGRIVCARKT